MEQDKEKIKRKAQKVVDNLGNVNLATLETSLEIVDKLEDVVETLKGHHQEMMDKPEKEMPEISLEETNTLLKELTEEVKKKEEYAYDIEIDPTLKAQLKGDKGDTVYVDKVIEKTEVIRETPIVTNEIVEVAKYQTPNEIATGLNTLEEKIDQKVIKGLTKKITDLSQNIANQAIGAMPVTTGFVNGNRAKNINITGATVTQSGDTANVAIPVTDLSGYVPYTGATTNLDLGANSLTTQNITINGTITANKFLYDGNRTITFGEEGLVATFTAPSATTTNIAGGNILFSGGTGNGSGTGGGFSFEGGAGGASGDGGGFDMLGGQGGTGQGGSIFIEAGNSTSFMGGDVEINAGSAQSGNNMGGSLTIGTGRGRGTGVGGTFLIELARNGAGTAHGDFIIENQASGYWSYLNFNNIVNDDRTFTFPDASGTIALTSNLSSYVPYTGATTNVNLGTHTLTTPTVIGGTATTATLTLQPTSGIGTTGADIIFKVGNNGATEAMRILNSGNVGIGTTSPSGQLHIRGAGATKATTALYVDNSATTQIFRINNDGSLNIGTSNTLTGTQAVAIGYLCTASGSNSIAMGYSSQATGTGALCIGPNAGSGYSYAVGNWSTVVGGLTHRAEANYSTLIGGLYGTTSIASQTTFGHDRFVSGTGTFQTSIVPLIANITGTAQTELLVKVDSSQAIIPVLFNGSTYYTMWNATITVNAHTISVGNGTGTQDHVFGGEYRCIVRRAFGSTTVTMVGSGVQTMYEDADTSMADAIVTIDGDSSTGALRVRFTPPTTAGSTTNTRVACTINYLHTARS